MRFWDTSAVLSLCVNEPFTPRGREFLKHDRAMVVWWGTRTECVSGLARRVGDGSLSAEAERQARKVLAVLTGAWSEMQPTEALRALTERLLAVHPLRAADAFQLAAALQWCQGQPPGLTIISLDARVRAAAHKEGFELLPEGLGATF